MNYYWQSYHHIPIELLIYTLFIVFQFWVEFTFKSNLLKFLNCYICMDAMFSRLLWGTWTREFWKFAPGSWNKSVLLPPKDICFINSQWFSYPEILNISIGLMIFLLVQLYKVRVLFSWGSWCRISQQLGRFHFCFSSSQRGKGNIFIFWGFILLYLRVPSSFRSCLGEGPTWQIFMLWKEGFFSTIVESQILGEHLALPSPPNSTDLTSGLLWHQSPQPVFLLVPCVICPPFTHYWRGLILSFCSETGLCQWH